MTDTTATNEAPACTVALDAPRSSGQLHVSCGLTDTAKRWISFHYNDREHAELSAAPKINGIAYEVFTITAFEDSRYGPWYPETIHLLRDLRGPTRRDLSDSARNTLRTWATTTATRLAETLDFDTARKTQQAAHHETCSRHVDELERALIVARVYEHLAATPVTLRPLAEPLPVIYECVSYQLVTLGVRGAGPLTESRRGTAHATILNSDGFELGYAVADDAYNSRTAGPVLVPGDYIKTAT